MTGYEPLNFLKPVAPDIWIIDGPAIRFYGMPFPTRATVVRLHNGDLWVHSPTHLTEDLVADLRALGPVRHLIAPNWIHYAWVEYWQAAFEEAEAWAAPGVLQRARRHGKALRFDHELGDAAPPEWAGQIDQMMVKGSAVHREVVFFSLRIADADPDGSDREFRAVEMPVVDAAVAAAGRHCRSGRVDAARHASDLSQGTGRIARCGRDDDRLEPRADNPCPWPLV
ncbi:DUF4336 domain-containing protein [Jhaorihella thermophila]